MVKIKIAAMEVGVSVKTLYNWIDSGLLKLADKGYVWMADVRQAMKDSETNRTEISSGNSKRLARDSNGRFVK